MTKKIAVVTGSNRGIGLEIARQLAGQKDTKVILTSRDESKGKKARASLCQQGLDVEFRPLDVTDKESIKRLANDIEKTFGRCDILVNNAGIFPDSSDANFNKVPSIFEIALETIEKAMATNVYGPLLLVQALVPLMKKNNYGRIVNLSSGLGQLTYMNAGYPAYRMSKTALNVLTRVLSEELRDFNILVNSMCPGWVKTDMGGPKATRSVAQGADTALWLATLPDTGVSGGFFRDRKEIPW